MNFCSLMMIWVVGLTPYAYVDCPEIQWETATELESHISYGKNDECYPLAVYETDENTIYMREKWRGQVSGNALAESVLAHELLHHLQKKHGKVPRNRRELVKQEREAYAVQDHYLKQKGWSDERILDTTRCGSRK